MFYDRFSLSPAPLSNGMPTLPSKNAFGSRAIATFAKIDTTLDQNAAIESRVKMHFFRHRTIKSHVKHEEKETGGFLFFVFFRRMIEPSGEKYAFLHEIYRAYYAPIRPFLKVHGAPKRPQSSKKSVGVVNNIVFSDRKRPSPSPLSHGIAISSPGCPKMVIPYESGEGEGHFALQNT